MRFITTGRVSNAPLPSHSLVTLQYYDVEPLILTGMSALAACVTETAVTLQVPSPSPLVATDAGVSVA